MPHAPATGAAELPTVLSELAGRRIRIGEIISALEVGRTTYYEQRDEGRLDSADNLLRLARALRINPVELLVRCGAVSHQAALDYASGAARVDGKRRTPRLQPRTDLPPM